MYDKDDFEQRYKKLVLDIKDSVPSAKIYIFNIIPQCNGKLGKTERNGIIRERNAFIASFCEGCQLPMIDLYNLFVDRNGDLKEEFTIDGVHINDKGYRIWAELLKPYIEE